MYLGVLAAGGLGSQPLGISPCLCFGEVLGESALQAKVLKYHQADGELELFLRGTSREPHTLIVDFVIIQYKPQ